ncbi:MULTISPECIES: STAS domain-containing protein [unclassified Streptomyces]|uniref:STAS domain-containing protein n=1 Tax=unclassified Streptomyces TaxID=2593676 RepID=UPI003649EC31
MTPHPCPARGDGCGALLHTRDGYHPHGPGASPDGDLADLPGRSCLHTADVEQHQQPRTVVQVTGEMDQDRGRQLRTELHAALDQSHGDVTVDLSGLVLCDSSGLNALLAARLHAVEKGRVLRLAGPSRQMLRLLELTGAKPLLPIDTTPPA